MREIKFRAWHKNEKKMYKTMSKEKRKLLLKIDRIPLPIKRQVRGNKYRKNWVGLLGMSVEKLYKFYMDCKDAEQERNK